MHMHTLNISLGHTPFCKRGKGGLVTALMQFAQRSILSHEWHYHNINKKVQHVNQLWNHKQLLCQSSRDSLSGYMQWKLPDPFPLLWDRVWPCKTNACTHDPTHTHTHTGEERHTGLVPRPSVWCTHWGSCWGFGNETKLSPSPEICLVSWGSLLLSVPSAR